VYDKVDKMAGRLTGYACLVCSQSCRVCPKTADHRRTHCRTRQDWQQNCRTPVCVYFWCSYNT